MRVLLVMTNEDWYSHLRYDDAWERALRERGCEVDRLTRVPPHWSVTGPPAGRWDLAVSHVLVEEAVAFGGTLRLSALLEAAGVPLLNPTGAILASSDKLVTHAVWEAAGVPQPRSWDLADVDEWPAPGEPLVLKPALGDGARHVTVVEDLPTAREVVGGWRPFERAGAAMLQEWVRRPRCIRLFATPDRVSLAYEKGVDAGGLITTGRYLDVFEAPEDLAGLARTMVASLGGGLMGVDVLVDAAGRMLALEANAPFGFDIDDREQGLWLADAALSLA